MTSAAQVPSTAFADALARWVLTPLSVLFVICVPLFLIGSNVRWVSLHPETYRSGFEKYRISAQTGLSNEQLATVADAFIDYFQGNSRRLNPTVTIDGAPQALLNEREIAHMEDVQKLMQVVYAVALLTGLYLLAFSVCLLVLRRGAGLTALGELGIRGAGLTLVALLLVAALSMIDFTELFVRFHQLSFRNDLWMLDPTRDSLLILFPEGFWLDVTLKIALVTAGESLALGAVGLVLTRL